MIKINERLNKYPAMPSSHQIKCSILTQYIPTEIVILVFKLQVA